MKARILSGAAAVVLSIAAALCTAPRHFGLTRQAVLTGLAPGPGHSFSTALPTGVPAPRQRVFLFPDIPQVLEDGVPLERAVLSNDDVERGGYGRYRVTKRKIIFSSSDGTSPLENRRTYTVTASAMRVGEPWLIVLWTLAAMGWAVFFRLSPPRGGMSARVSPVLGAGAAGALALAFWAWPVAVGDAFMNSLWLPALWALTLSAVAGSPTRWRVAGMLLLSIIPALASWAHYALGGSSHDSFLVAGFMPYSDANMHFSQAGEIVRQGFTNLGFNGRFLYPAYFGDFLHLFRENLSAANCAIAVVAMLCLVPLILIGRSLLGLGGTALTTLLIWLYYRVHGCGLVMTENLGLTLGLLGTAALLLAWRERSTSLLLTGIFALALGSSARPGALFILPFLLLAGGWETGRGSSTAMPRRIARATLVMIAGGLLVLLAFAANTLLQRALYHGEARPFGNFAYTLNGLVTGSNWRASYEKTSGDPARVMQETLEIIRREPLSLARGVGRAYGESFETGFLYRFGAERRLAATMMLLAALGIGGVWLLPAWRPYAVLICASVLGVLLSLPFAPPWDAELRPYAATIPFQSLLPGFGLALVLKGARRLVLRESPPPLPLGNGLRPALLAATGLLTFLVIPLPLLFAALMKSTPAPTASGWPPEIRPGSRLRLASTPTPGAVTLADFHERLSSFTVEQSGRGQPFEVLRGDCLLALDWETNRLCALREPLPASEPHLVRRGLLMVDPALVKSTAP